MRPRDQRHQRCINFTRPCPVGLVHEAQFLTASPDRNWHRDRDPTGVLQLQGQHSGIAAKRHGKQRKPSRPSRIARKASNAPKTK
jgi:hypothetical protein